MAELTETMVRGWLAKTDPDGSQREHISSTVWEEHQLCRAWLALAASQREREQLQARVEAAEKLLRVFTTPEIISDEGVNDAMADAISEAAYYFDNVASPPAAPSS